MMIVRWGNACLTASIHPLPRVSIALRFLFHVGANKTAGLLQSNLAAGDNLGLSTESIGTNPVTQKPTRGSQPLRIKSSLTHSLETQAKSQPRIVCFGLFLLEKPCRVQTIAVPGRHSRKG
jgi:hypothetical protein